MDLSTLLDTAERLALKASGAIIAIYAREFAIKEKADKAAHEVMVAGLQALPEGIPAPSEDDT